LPRNLVLSAVSIGLVIRSLGCPAAQNTISKVEPTISFIRGFLYACSVSGTARTGASNPCDSDFGLGDLFSVAHGLAAGAFWNFHPQRWQYGCEQRKNPGTASPWAGNPVK
jgi:hypothetical protein